jgi:hypothetical protein
MGSIPVQASPLHRNFYTLYFGQMFFLLFSLVWAHFVCNLSAKIGIFRISGINLSHLGADLSILGAKKRFRGVKTQIPLKNK